MTIPCTEIERVVRTETKVEAIEDSLTKLVGAVESINQKIWTTKGAVIAVMGVVSITSAIPPLMGKFIEVVFHAAQAAPK